MRIEGGYPTDAFAKPVIDLAIRWGDGDFALLIIGC